MRDWRLLPAWISLGGMLLVVILALQSGAPTPYSVDEVIAAYAPAMKGQMVRVRGRVTFLVREFGMPSLRGDTHGNYVLCHKATNPPRQPLRDGSIMTWSGRVVDLRRFANGVDLLLTDVECD